MDRVDRGHMDESLNLRSFYLRLIRKIWIVPIAAVIGALIGAGIYSLVTITFGPEKTYRSESRLYISFAYDENKGSLVDWYNAYTWTNMLLPTDDILNPIMENLAEQGVSAERDQVLASIKAEIPSDVRLMLLTVENRDKAFADAVTKAAIKSLEHYGAINDAFDSIKLLGTSEAELVLYSDKTVVAAVFAAVVFMIATVMVMFLKDSLDDAVYVPEDMEKRYGLSVLGTIMKGNTGSFYRNELIAALSKRTKGGENIYVIATDSVEDDVHSTADCNVLKEVLGDSLGADMPNLMPLTAPGKVLDNYRKLSTSDGVILAIPYGLSNGSMNEHVISQLKKHDCPIVGLLLVRADEKFMNRYYRLK